MTPDPTFSVPLVLQVILAGLAGGLLSMAAAALVTFGLPRLWLSRAVGFSVGVLLGTAFLILLPEGLEMADYPDPRTQFIWLLGGLLGFHALERLALWRHDHGGEEENCPIHGHALPSTPALILLGDGVHNFADGLLLAAAFLADPALGWATALAVIAHEIPQEAGDFVLLLSAGWSKRRAFLANGASSLASVLGGVIGLYALESFREWLPVILTLAASSFIYIAIADLLPWLRHHRERRSAFWHGGAIALGLVLVLAIPHSH